MTAGVKITLYDKKFKQAVKQEATKKMHEAVNEFRNTVLETLSGDRTGRTYYVPGTRRTYTASAPGEPPAQATSELRQSIKTNVKGEGTKIIGSVGTDKIQGLMTEFGTRNMAARPWLRKSFEKVLPKIKEIFLKRW